MDPDSKVKFDFARLKIGIVIMVITIIGFLGIHQQGISWDEITEISMVRWNLEWITKQQPIPGDLKYYGSVFNGAAELIYEFQQRLQDPTASTPDQGRILYQVQGNLRDSTAPQSEDQPMLDRIRSKHLVTFVFSLGAYLAVAGLVEILVGIEWAWMGALILAFFPSFWGHSFFNPKDIPFAVAFTISTLLGSYLINRYLQVVSSGNIQIRSLGLATIGYGIVVGLTAGIRIAGVLSLFFLPITFVGVLGFKKGGFQSCKSKLKIILAGYSLLMLSSLATITLVYPSAWSNPLSYFLEAAGYLSKHGYRGTSLFNGQFIPGDSLPWQYLPTWIVITTPILLSAFAVIGIGASIKGYKDYSDLQKSAISLIAFQTFFLPVFAVLKHSVLYDGYRHFLFVVPGLAVLSIVGISAVYQSLYQAWAKFAFVVIVVISLATVCRDVVMLHPYEYAYFNRLSGGLAHAYQKYETDYWGLSLREAMEWTSKNAQAGSNILIGGNPYIAALYANSNLSLHSIYESGLQMKKPFYYVVVPKWDWQQNYSDCPVVFQTMRQGIPLTIVKRCD